MFHRFRGPQGGFADDGGTESSGRRCRVGPRNCYVSALRRAASMSLGVSFGIVLLAAEADATSVASLRIPKSRCLWPRKYPMSNDEFILSVMPSSVKFTTHFHFDEFFDAWLPRFSTHAQCAPGRSCFAPMMPVGVCFERHKHGRHAAVELYICATSTLTAADNTTLSHAAECRITRCGDGRRGDAGALAM